MKTNFFKLAVSIIICLAAGFLGSIFTTPYIATWYASLNKPAFNPPNWIFGPAWTILFILMGISFYLVWQKNFKTQISPKLKRIKAWNPWSQKLWSGEWQKANVILIFIIQLVLNILWSFLFFYMQNPYWAFVELLMLWFAILYTIINFCLISKTAAYLLLPYILWVTFAGVLNLSIFMLNI